MSTSPLTCGVGSEATSSAMGTSSNKSPAGGGDDVGLRGAVSIGIVRGGREDRSSCLT